MIKIYFCDDNEETIERGKDLFKEFSHKTQTDLKLSTFKRAEDMLFYMEDSFEIPHIIYLDIFMDELNGMETAKKLREMDFEGEIIFLTTSPDFVFEAFDVRSFNYLVKQDVDDERFFQVLEQAIHEIKKTEVDFFECSMGAELRKIPLSEISHFEIFRRVVCVYFGEDYFEFYSTMDELEEQLKDKGFVRVQRSYIVNLNHIKLFKTNSLVLSSGVEIPIGKTYQKNIREQFSIHNRERWGS